MAVSHYLWVMKMSDMQARFEAALHAFTDKTKSDVNIRAVILYGSLANDTVWKNQTWTYGY